LRQLPLPILSGIVWELGEKKKEGFWRGGEEEKRRDKKISIVYVIA
jgi:hypothetical protein